MKRNEKIKTDKAILRCRRIIQNKDDIVIFKADASGNNKNSVIIRFAFTDLDNNILLESLVKPTLNKSISRDVTELTGLRKKDLIDAPSFKSFIPEIERIIKNKIVILYYTDYFEELVYQTCEQDDAKLLHFIKTVCASKLYSNYKAVWSDYHCDYRYYSLPGKKFNAVKDCKSIVRLLNRIANTELFHSQEIIQNNFKPIVIKEWWQFWK